MQLPLSIRALTTVFGLLFIVTVATHSASAVAQIPTARDFTVEVIVTDPGAKQRASAYWLALSMVLDRNMPAGIIDENQRQEVLRDPARYVQSFRYRPYVEADDPGLLATRQVREGAPADSVIVVTFPTTLPGNIQRQFLAQPIEEEVVTPGSGRILALVAVEQDGKQFLIGGETAKKFQSRMIQLGAANNLVFEFPLLDEEDRAIISPANVLFSDQAVFDAITQKYQSSGRLSASLLRIGETSWQSDWQYNFPGNKNGDLSLTTRSLDEALLTAVTEIASGGSSFGGSLLAGNIDFERGGVAIRVENINTLAHHQQVLQLLRSIDESAVAEGLEPGVTVYRAQNTDVFNLQQRLANQPALTLLPEQTGDASIAYRLR